MLTITVVITVVCSIMVIAYFFFLPDRKAVEIDFNIDGIHPVIRAAEVLEQRKYCRWQGPAINVMWTPGQDYEVDVRAMWILRNPGDGVSVVIDGDIKNSLSKGDLR